MRTFAKRLGPTLAILTVTLWAAQARAMPSYYTANCASCHSTSSATPTTCNGCHFHGTHSGSGASDINLKGTTDKASYAPGETVKVTITGGWQSGWVRAVLYDQNLTELARSSCPGGHGGCTTSAYPITVSAPAPATAGSYVWAFAWYGNQYDRTGATFGSGTSSTIKVGFFTPDPGNPNHGFQTVALPAFTVTAPSAAPAIALNPAALGFGTVNLGASSTLSARVQNTGTAPLNVTGIAACAGTPVSISWSPAGPFTVAAAGSTALNVTFAPTAAGALPAGACLAIASNDPARPTINLALSGTGAAPPAPAIALNPASLGFGTVNVGTSKVLSTQVQNTGTAPLNVTGIAACAGTPVSISWSPAGPFTVAAAGSTTVNVTFAPTAAGVLPAGACLTIASNDPARPTVNLALSGTGAPPPAPAIALNPASLGFGTVNVGTSKVLSTQVQNTGTAPLNVTGIAACAGTPVSISWSPAGPFTVAAAGSTTVNVTFAPTAAGVLPAGACLTIASNDPAKPTVNLALSGTGATPTPGPAIALNPASLAFGTVNAGTSKTLTTQVQNTGGSPLNVTGISRCGGTPVSISWSPAAPFTVAAAGSRALNVTFAPTATGALPAGACLTIASNDPARPTINLALSGTGAIPSAVALNPASLAFGTVSVGASKTLTTQVQNTGGSPLDVTGIAPCAGTPVSISWSPAAPFTVAPAARTTLNVAFAPTATGALPAGACLTIASNDPAKPTINLALSGTGAPPPAPAIALNPGSLNFGTVNVGTSRVLSTQVQNTGTAPLSVTGISPCAGTPVSISWTPAAPFTLAVSGTASLNVTFAPTGAGALPAGACLTIASNDPANPTVNLALSGTGVAVPSGPAIALSPASLDFQSLTVGTSKTLVAQVQNTGGSPLDVTRISACNGTPASVSWTAATPITLAASGSTNLNVTFAPTAAGALPSGACLTIASNDPAKPAIHLVLAGTGTGAPAPAIAVDPDWLDFGTVAVAASKSLVVAVKNAGSAPLDVRSIAACDGTPSSLSWNGTVPVTVPPGASVSISVSFAPSAAGALPAGSCLRIASSDPANGTLDLDITGSGSIVGAAEAQIPMGCTTAGSGWSLATVAALLFVARRRRRRDPAQTR